MILTLNRERADTLFGFHDSKYTYFGFLARAASVYAFRR